ncbi:MAG: hypothetical protein M3203_14565 [Actinomycetota bacterium]|nr:hypothetical protein [Actinomycetota bacterium]
MEGRSPARTHLPDLVVQSAKGLGAEDAALYLVDYEQRLLVPVPNPNGPAREEVVIDATLAGRCCRTLEIQTTGREKGGVRIWVPVLDGVERLGALELAFPAEGPNLDDVRLLAGLVAEIVMTKQAYGDLLEQVRRRQPISVAAELAWRLLPPLTFGTEELVISGVLAPADKLGGSVSTAS